MSEQIVFVMRDIDRQLFTVAISAEILWRHNCET